MTRDRVSLVSAVQGIIAQYPDMRLTLRQIYYRLVAAQIFPNVLSSYKWLSTVLVDARKDGQIAYSSIEDRTRPHVDGHGTERSAAEQFNRYWNYVTNLDRNYTMPKWWHQPKRVQVWLEKQALSALFRQVTDAQGVDLEVCRGYPSLTFLWEAAENSTGLPDGQEIEILYFGDFDPSGEDIERYVGESLRSDFGIDVNVTRVAITRSQIDQYQIPPAPAKTTDSRYGSFVAEHGVAWQVELDAIEPRVLQGLVRDAVRAHWERDASQERDIELSRRQAQIRSWLDDAVNQDFTPPEGDA